MPRELICISKDKKILKIEKESLKSKLTESEIKSNRTITTQARRSLLETLLSRKVQRPIQMNGIRLIQNLFLSKTRIQIAILLPSDLGHLQSRTVFCSTFSGYQYTKSELFSACFWKSSCLFPNLRKCQELLILCKTH